MTKHPPLQHSQNCQLTRALLDTWSGATGDSELQKLAELGLTNHLADCSLLSRTTNRPTPLLTANVNYNQYSWTWWRHL